MNQLPQQVSYELATAFFSKSTEKKQLTSNIQHGSIAPHKASTFLNCFSKTRKDKSCCIQIVVVSKSCIHLLQNEQADSRTEEFYFPCLHSWGFLSVRNKETQLQI